MDQTRRYDSRRPINHHVDPGPLVGTTEAFVIENLSTGGMSLVRAAPSSSDVLDKKCLDLRFSVLTVPLPGSNDEVTTLIDVVHRERRGATELIRARFEEMSFCDRVKLCDYLEQRDQQAPDSADGAPPCAAADPANIEACPSTH